MYVVQTYTETIIYEIFHVHHTTHMYINILYIQCIYIYIYKVFISPAMSHKSSLIYQSIHLNKICFNGTTPISSISFCENLYTLKNIHNPYRGNISPYVNPQRSQHCNVPLTSAATWRLTCFSATSALFSSAFTTTTFGSSRCFMSSAAAGSWHLCQQNTTQHMSPQTASNRLHSTAWQQITLKFNE